MADQATHRLRARVWADGSCFSKVIPARQAGGHQVVASQHSLHTLEADVATVRRALGRVSCPAILVSHCYGGTGSRWADAIPAT